MIKLGELQKKKKHKSEYLIKMYKLVVKLRIYKEDNDYLLPTKQKAVVCSTMKFTLNHPAEEW